MQTLKNAQENFAQVYDSSGRKNSAICDIFHLMSEFIPDEVNVDTLMTAFKIAFAEYERTKPSNQLINHLSVIPQTIRDMVDQEFYLEFWKEYNREILGLPRHIPETDENCIEVEPDVIDISKKDRNSVLAALYNAAIPIGAGIYQYNPTHWDENHAALAFEQLGEQTSDGGIFFGWVLGRPLRCTFKKKYVYVAGYNQNQAPGLAQIVIAAVPDKDKKNKKQQKVKSNK